MVEAKSIDDYLKDELLIKLKNDMNNGIRNPLCNPCYNIEDHYPGSNRLWWLSHTSNDIYESDNFSHLEIRFSNICNSKCRTCIPNTSSPIATEEKKYSNWTFPVLRYSGPDENFVLNESKKIASNLKTVTFSGGEPMLQWQHWDFLDYLIENNLNPKLLYYSNGTILTFKDQHIFDKWKHFGDVNFRVSIDAVNESAEYWRHGEKWDTIIKNVKKVKHFMPNVTLEYTFTVSWPNVFHIEKVIDALTFNAKPQINFNLVYSDLFNLQVLPKNIKIRVEEYFSKINKNKVDQNILNGFISFMNSEDKSDLMTSAIARLKEVDLRREESFIDAFPEYKEMAIEYGY
jgi:hypothetical protein